jgi:holo-[acyl-carrier protein] synthase
MIIGTGTDLMETERIRALIAIHGDRFLCRWFDPGEIAYCKSKAKPHLHFAARFAAKEAVFKALRLSVKTPLCWKHIVIEREDDGAPQLALRGEPLAAAHRLGVTSFHLSLSHGDAYAVATVIAERSRY